MKNEVYFVFIYTDGKGKIYQIKYLLYLWSRLEKAFSGGWFFTKALSLELQLF